MKDKKINKILLVVNPVSGNTDKSPFIDLVKAKISSNCELRIYETTGNGDADKISKNIAEFCPSRILAMGGDGTLKVIAEASKSSKTVIGILPAGSANGLATALNLPTTMKEALEVALSDTFINLDLSNVDDHACLHVGDLGLNAELIKNYADSNLRGYFGYAISALPTLKNTGIPYKFTIQANGKTLHREAIVIAFTNVRKYGTGALINPIGIMDDGKFELLIFKKLDLLGILKTLLGNIPLESDFVEVISTTEAHIICASPVELQLDGEAMGKRKNLEVRLFPDRLKIAVGT